MGVNEFLVLVIAVISTRTTMYLLGYRKANK